MCGECPVPSGVHFVWGTVSTLVKDARKTHPKNSCCFGVFRCYKNNENSHPCMRRTPTFDAQFWGKKRVFFTGGYGMYSGLICPVVLCSGLHGVQMGFQAGRERIRTHPTRVSGREPIRKWFCVSHDKNNVFANARKDAGRPRPGWDSIGLSQCESGVGQVPWALDPLNQMVVLRGGTAGRQTTTHN